MPTWVTILVTITTSGVGAFVLNLVKSYHDLMKQKNRRLLIGVVHCYPPLLAPYPIYTDVKKAIKSEYPICIIVCRNLSYALTHCDIVVCDTGTDEKIIKPTDEGALRSWVQREEFALGTDSK